MKPRFRNLLAVAFWAMIGVSASGQTPTIRLVPDTTSIAAGETVTVEVFIEDLPRALKAYQVDLQVSGGTSGSLDLASPESSNLFVDSQNPLWVLADWFTIGGDFFPLIATNTSTLMLAGSLTGFTSGLGPFAEPRYLGTIVLRASVSASGTFDVGFDGVDGSSTFLRGNVTIIDPILPFNVVETSIFIREGPPPNDECTGALSVTDGLTAFNLDEATASALPLPGSCDEGNGLGLEQDIWFNYTATCDGIVSMSTCGSANFDTRMAVYGDSLANCICPITSAVLACNDDFLGCSGGTSEAVVTTVAGNCFTIRLGSFSPVGLGASGNLTITCIANDTCLTSEFISIPSTVSGSTRSTNSDTGLLACTPFGTSTDGPGVWYRVSGVEGVMTATINSANFDSRLTVFDGNTCSGLGCVAGSDNGGGTGESVSWCATLGLAYYLLVHGPAGESGGFQLSVSGQSCDDSNACTLDTCTNAACSNVDNTTPAGFCCDPVDASLADIDDGNPCTTDICNADGSVSHPAAPNGPNLACDDAFGCTLDECISGNCANTDINTISCFTVANCPTQASDCTGGFCDCFNPPTLNLIADPGSLPQNTCYAVGETITVRAEMDANQTGISSIVTGQMFLEYDPSTLTLLGVDPGSTVDPTSPFSFAFPPSVDAINGTIDYAIGVPPGGTGTLGPATMAVFRFQAIAQCGSFVRFRPNDPPTQLLDDSAESHIPDGLTNDPIVQVSSGPPALTACPSSIIVPAAQGLLSAAVSYTPPTASDTCVGSVPVSCLPPPGSVFLSGTTLVRCAAFSACGLEGSCTFSVTVVPSELTVDVELSPLVAPGPIDRCITFDLWDCTNGFSATVESTLSFVDGLASGAVIEIPGGTWECLSARDALHSLRRTADDFATGDGVNYTATFVGDPDFGGDWLVGGNLNDDAFIDVTDFALFLQQFLSPLPVSTPCGTLPFHADINGGGVVEVADLSFIQASMFESSEGACCGAANASTGAPVTAISLQELRRKGLGHLHAVDINGDGMLDLDDVNAFLEAPPTVAPGKPQPDVPTPRRGKKGRGVGRPTAEISSNFRR